jgi:hypothetical protein
MERLLRMPRYLSRRELVLHRIPRSSKELAESRRIASLGREDWLEVLDEFVRNPLLEESLIDCVGESWFVFAKEVLEEKFAHVPAP